MENASKALIIAGAILISILIIGLGVFVFSGASDTVNNANLNSEKAQAHNGKFTNYFGQRVSASQVKALMKEVITNNVLSDTNEELIKIFIKVESVQSGSKLGTGIQQTSAVTSGVRSGYTYAVNALDDKSSDDTSKLGQFGYYKSGYLQTIKISENAKGSGN